MVKMTCFGTVYKKKFNQNMDEGATASKRNIFTEKEKTLIVDLVESKLNIIECKKTDQFYSKQKDEEWKNLTVQFNAVSDTSRTTKQLKTCYENIKKRARKSVTSDLAEAIKTGGASFVSKVTPFEARVIQMLREQFISAVDNDTQFYEDGELAYTVETLSPEEVTVEVSLEAAERSPDIQEPEVLEMAARMTSSQEQVCHQNISLDMSKKTSKTKSNIKSAEILHQQETVALQFQKRKLEMAEELHAKRLILIDLEIQIKKAELLAIQTKSIM